ncbi:EcoAI/FtnUII family type I restriction enzme subunit R [Roseibacillus persicicus]|uniref:EcoAI/FtnUII family type I restriction enzme subunit R n=1 Tax=Roseibacillus persicicus TaxID=454148 RepID=UPI00280EFFD8|nr:DEAD/DEAH box helicase family protein [Roseibacillus persicicus]MDQ8192539.1 DEAD/DEAH box helicase family protein [Roseibacillus persicicus]
MNEAQTRHDLIDPALKSAGWGVVESSRIRLEFPITDGRIIGKKRRKQPLSADYVLEYRNKRLAIIEAKARHCPYTTGLGQAKDYAQRLNIRYTYATNGQKIYGVDMDEGVEGDVESYPTPEELWEMTFPQPKELYKQEIADWKARFEAVPFALFKGQYLPRYFQHVAIEKTLDAIAAKQNRILLTMATGTGKTATAFHICWKLFQAKWNLKRDGQRSPRILFLADRNLLADQAFNSFGEFDEDSLVRITPKDIKKKGKVPTNGSVFFTIFQSFMANDQSEAEREEEEELLDSAEQVASPAPLGMVAEAEIKYGGKKSGESYFGQYAPDFFDFIIIDECHRGGANDEGNWRKILDHFSPAVQLGLTATPKRDVNADTYKYFGEPIYTYKLKDGINDGFLTPFKVREISTTLDRYTFTKGDLIESGDIDPNKEYSESEINRIIEIKEREAYRVKLFLSEINQNHKTLVFCATQRHAATVRDLINQYADSKSPNYCHRVTAEDGGIGEAHLRDFQDNEKSIPTILTTSQKLSTGVDAPEVRNIVLMRPVKSMVEFKQIVGRGTRLFEGKDYFTIYDFVEAHEHFKDPEWDGDPEPPAGGDGDGGKKPPCQACGERPCICEKPEPEPCSDCENWPCICETGPRQFIEVKLSQSRSLAIDSMMKTSFWSADGSMISAEEFVQQLFGDIPSLFQDEAELRKIWSLPSTRRRLLEELSEKGYTEAQLEDLSKLVHGEDSDLFDVLAYVAYQKDLVPRHDRAQQALIQIKDYDPKQQAFLNFVLSQYVKEGVTELDDAKLGDLLKLNYGAIDDAKTQLGAIPTIRSTFIGFQKHLYQAQAS